jgi:hypothetical protein
MVATSLHVGVRQVLRWALFLFHEGITAVGDWRIEVRPAWAPLTPGQKHVLITMKTNMQETVALSAWCQDPVEGPIEVQWYQPAVWTVDLYRAVVQAASGGRE